MKRKMKVDESNVHKESNRKDWEGRTTRAQWMMGRACEIPSVTRRVKVTSAKRTWPLSARHARNADVLFFSRHFWSILDYSS